MYSYNAHYPACEIEKKKKTVFFFCSQKRTFAPNLQSIQMDMDSQFSIVTYRIDSENEEKTQPIDR